MTLAFRTTAGPNLANESQPCAMPADVTTATRHAQNKSAFIRRIRSGKLKPPNTSCFHSEHTSVLQTWRGRRRRRRTRRRRRRGAHSSLVLFRLSEKPFNILSTSCQLRVAWCQLWIRARDHTYQSGFFPCVSYAVQQWRFCGTLRTSMLKRAV